MNSGSEVTYRWVDGPFCSQADWDAIDERLASRGWMSLNRRLARIRIAERDGRIVGFYCLQHIPHVEPLWIERDLRGQGVAERLIDDMQEFLVESRARGYMVIAENPLVAKLCEAHKMEKVQYPVYVSVAEAK